MQGDTVLDQLLCHFLRGDFAANTVSEAAMPMGNGKASFSTKCFRTNAENTTPSRAPDKLTAASAVNETSASGSSIQIPGNVKAIPPAIIAPADIAVCVTLISFKFVLPMSFRILMERIATKIVGQGSAPMRSATYMELVVMTTEPRAPMITPLSVNCSENDFA